MKTQVMNPILPSWEYIPDVEPRVYGNRLYLYGSHDRFGGNDFCLNDYVVWSAPVDNLGQMTFHGVIYSPKMDPANLDGKQNGFAPDCVQGIDGRYYLYYCLHLSSQVSVAVADTPTGPFHYYGVVHAPDGTVFGQEKSVFCFDPGVLVDDGRIFLYIGFGLNGDIRQFMLSQGFLCDGCYCLELSSDMLTIRSQPILVLPSAAISSGTSFEGHAFYEASSPRKIGNIYYLVYSSELSHELCYATAKTPYGPFTYGGTLISIGDLGYRGNKVAVNYLENTHGGLVCLKGRWAIFYHRQTNRCRYARQCCAEWLDFSEGKFYQTEMTSQGLNDGPLIARGYHEARIACNLSSGKGTTFYPKTGVIDTVHPYFTQEGPEDGKGRAYIANLQSGSWAAFKYFATTSENLISIVYRGNGKGTLRVGTTHGHADVANLSIHSVKHWTTISAPLIAWVGSKPLYFEYVGNGAIDFAGFEILSHGSD